MSETHAFADVKGLNIGSSTCVWQYSVALEGAFVGPKYNICAHTPIAIDTVVGCNTAIKSGIFLRCCTCGEGNILMRPHVTFINDSTIVFKIYPDVSQGITVKAGVNIGASAILIPGITTGRNIMVGADSVVTKDAPDSAVVVGNPARIIRYLDK